MFLTSAYLWNVILKTTTDTTKVSEGDAHKALLYGFFTITFFPLLVLLCALDLLLYFLSRYVIPVLSIAFMLFVGFPVLKFLQWLYLTLVFVLNVFREYRHKLHFVFSYTMGNCNHKLHCRSKNKDHSGDALDTDESKTSTCSMAIEEMYYQS